jgi:nuclear pore complex protein Nup107
LRAARAFSNKVSGRAILQRRELVTPQQAEDDAGPGWFEEFCDLELSEEFLQKCGMDQDQLTTMVRNLWELECLVRVLDAMETLSSLAGLSRE